MRIVLDTEKCQGHGRCWGLAPALFDSDDNGNAVLRGDGTVPEGQEEAARLAEENCPEYAITVEQ
jgi:ferredoxin